MTIALLFSLLLAAVGAVIYHITTAYHNLQDMLSQEQAKNRTQEWADKITAQESKIQEEEKDYENAKKTFEDGSNPPPSGAV